MWKYLAVLGCVLYAVNVHSAPQGTPNEVQQPYEYQYEVKDPEKNLFFDKNESGDATGKSTKDDKLNKYSEYWISHSCHRMNSLDPLLLITKVVRLRKQKFEPE